MLNMSKYYTWSDHVDVTHSHITINQNMCEIRKRRKKNLALATDSCHYLFTFLCKDITEPGFWALDRSEWTIQLYLQMPGNAESRSFII